MTQPKNEKVTSFAGYIASSVRDVTLKNLSFSSFPAGDILKIRGRLKNLSGNTKLQLEYFLTEGRVKQENLPDDAIEDALFHILGEGCRNCQLVTSDLTATLLVSKKGVVNTTYKRSKQIAAPVPGITGNNREKKYIFSGSESFMKELGISDNEGRVHDKKQSKFRQINRFTEQVRDIVKYLPESGTLHVYDLCCGKSYLSFAVYDYLVNILGRDVEMICADLKESVMDFCRNSAEKVGFTGMKFICADVASIAAPQPPDLVISLHACNTATDAVLSFAINNGAAVILATPCCQREMFNIMDCPELEFISKYSILKQKIASAATDALRLARLEEHGYRTDAIELIDPDETPKNVLLRGILKERQNVNTRSVYKDSYKFMTGKEIPNDRA